VSEVHGEGTVTVYSDVSEVQGEGNIIVYKDVCLSYRVREWFLRTELCV